MSDHPSLDNIRIVPREDQATWAFCCEEYIAGAEEPSNGLYPPRELYETSLFAYRPRNASNASKAILSELPQGAHVETQQAFDGASYKWTKEYRITVPSGDSESNDPLLKDYATFQRVDPTECLELLATIDGDRFPTDVKDYFALKLQAENGLDEIEVLRRSAEASEARIALAKLRKELSLDVILVEAEDSDRDEWYLNDRLVEPSKDGALGTLRYGMVLFSSEGASSHECRGKQFRMPSQDKQRSTAGIKFYPEITEGQKLLAITLEDQFGVDDCRILKQMAPYMAVLADNKTGGGM